MSTTAVEAWAAGRAEHPDPAGMDEGLSPDDERGGAPTPAGSATPDQSTQKRQQGVLLLVGAGVLAALVIGFVGLVAYKRAQQQFAAEASEAQPRSSPQPLSQSGAIPGGQDSQAPIAPITAMPASGSATGWPPTTGALDPSAGSETKFGLPTVGAPMAAATASQAANAIQAQLATSPAMPVTGVAPVGAADLEKLRADIGALRSDAKDRANAVAALRTELASLRAQISARDSSPRATVRPARSPDSSSPPSAASPAGKGSAASEPRNAQQPPMSGSNGASSPIVTSTGSLTQSAPIAARSPKVRTDYRIYAIVDDRVWVVGADNEPVQVGVGSPLTDGSKITSVDPVAHLVVTNAGEIR